MVIVKTAIVIDAPVEVCFRLATDIDVHTQTVWKHTKERAIEGVKTGPIGLGQTVKFQATHFGVRQTLTSKITEYEAPLRFVDEMQQGAFKSLRHVHEFERLPGGITKMTDILHFEAPFGVIGSIVERLILKRYMTRFLEHRNRELKRIAER